jgi:hypothetical protein
MVNRVVPEAKRIATVETLAAEIVANPPLAVRANVRAMRWFVNETQRQSRASGAGGQERRQGAGVEGPRAAVPSTGPLSGLVPNCLTLASLLSMLIDSLLPKLGADSADSRGAPRHREAVMWNAPSTT